MGLNVKFFTFTKLHNKKQTGSTDIRVMNLLKYWEDASLYRFGDDYDVLVFQKVYAGQDYKMPVNAKGIKILDIADPDWLDNAMIVETVKAMDAVVTPTEELADFIRQFADCPVKVIKDRFDISEFPEPKKHTGDGEKVFWFGYSHNAENLKPAIRSLEKLGLELTIFANQDPMPYRWAENSKEYEKLYNYIPFDKDTLYETMQKHDMVLFPQGFRPQDRFKSENKTVIAQLCGMPVAKSKDDMIMFNDPKIRQNESDKQYDRVKVEYDCKRSISEYKQLIEEVS